jgi:hypothetical protein
MSVQSRIRFARKRAEQLAGVESRLSLLTWMVGTLVPINIALTAGVLWRVMSIHA